MEKETKAKEASSAPPGGQAPTKEQLAAHSLHVTSAFGQIVTIFMHSAKHRLSFIGELEWLAAPAVASGQYAIAEAQDNKSGFKTPVGVVLWASVSQAVDQRLSASSGRPRLKPEEWVSGPIPWLIDAVGEPRATARLLRSLVETRFAATGIKTLDQVAGGNPVVRVLTKNTTEMPTDAPPFAAAVQTKGPTEEPT